MNKFAARKGFQHEHVVQMAISSVVVCAKVLAELALLLIMFKRFLHGNHWICAFSSRRMIEQGCAAYQLFKIIKL